MSYKYILHESAQEDYESSLGWYLERSEQATERFIAAMDASLQLICEHPKRWSNKYKSYYELGLKGYPFTIIYTIEEDKKLIVVSAVYHHKRNPKKKYRAIK